MSACARSATSRQSAPSTPQKPGMRQKTRNLTFFFVSFLYTRLLHRKMRRPFLHFFRQQMRGKCSCKHVSLQIDISESAFFALLIYQLLFEQKMKILFVVLLQCIQPGRTPRGNVYKFIAKSLFRLRRGRFFYAKRRSIQVAQFFSGSLFISAKASIPVQKQEQYLFVFVLQICNLHLSFCAGFCYHNCIQRGVCRTPVHR